MRARIALALLSIVGTTVVVWWYAASAGDSAVVVEPLQVETREVEGDGDGRGVDGDTAPPTTDARASAVPAQDAGSVAAEVEALDENAATVRLHGRVLDLEGRPLVDVLVTGTDTSVPVRTGGDGAFSFTATTTMTHAEQRGVLAIDDEGWATVFESPWSATEPEREHLVVAAPAIRVAGTVTDQDLDYMPNARVRVALLHHAGDRFPHALDAGREAEYEAYTGEDGRFVFERLPAIPADRGVLLFASAPGFDAKSADLPTAPTSKLHFLLTKDAPPELRIVGVVLLPDGTPAEGAEVRFRDAQESADKEGRFRLACDVSGEEGDALLAVLAGYGPDVRASYGGVVEAHAPSSPPALRLQLGEDLAIAGRVLGTDDAPLAGWYVQLADPTPSTPGQVGGLFAEHPTSDAKRVETTEDGRFRLAGLLDRDYRLLAYDPETLMLLKSVPIPAGASDVVLREPDVGYHDELVVRVVDRAGLPIDDVRVHLRAVVSESAKGSRSAGRPVVRTNADGVAHFARVPRRGVTLTFDGAYVESDALAIEDCDDPSSWTVELARRVRVRLISPADLDLELEYSFRDADGEYCSVLTIHDGSRSSTSHEPLTPGRNPLRYVSQDAARLIVSRGTREVLVEQDVWLEPDAVTEIVVEQP